MKYFNYLAVLLILSGCSAMGRSSSLDAKWCFLCWHLQFDEDLKHHGLDDDVFEQVTDDASDSDETVDKSLKVVN